MKSGTFTMILQGALALSLVLSAIFCLQHIIVTREARSLRMQNGIANAYRATIQAMLNDCVEYSKKNAAILPVLKSVGVEVTPPAK